MLWYDLMIRTNARTVSDKQVVITRRIALPYLNKVLRVVQDEGMYIIGVIPLFKKREDSLTVREVFQKVTGISGFADKDMPPSYDRLDHSTIDSQGM